MARAHRNRAPRGPAWIRCVAYYVVACSLGATVACGGHDDVDAGPLDAGNSTDAAPRDSSSPDSGVDGGEPDAGPPPPVPIDEFLARQAEAACEWARVCGGTCRSLEGSGPSRPDVAFVESVRAGVAAGRVAYDPTLARECLSARYDAARCDRPWRGSEIDACRRMVQGTVPNGQPCFGDGFALAYEECAEGYCQYGLGCPGTCQPYRAGGEPCAAAAYQCEPTMVCNGTSVGCGTPLNDGEACSGEGRNPPCSAPTRCVTVGPEPTDKECREVRPAGAVCERSDQCSGNLSCVDGTCDAPAAGDPCKRTQACPAGTACLDQDEDVDTERTCAPRLSVGDPCTSVSADGCPGRCREARCETPPSVGDLCQSDDFCQPDLACVDGACAPIESGAEGQACQFNRACMRDLVCGVDDLCVRPTMGSACTPDRGNEEQCIEPLVCSSEATCTLPPPIGTACATDEDCDPHSRFAGLYCLDGACQRCFGPPVEEG